MPPIALALSLQRSRSVPRSVVLDVRFSHSFSGAVDRAAVMFLLSADGYRQISTVTRFQAHPSGFLHWSRGPCYRAAGGFLLTGAILKARSTGDVSGSLADRGSNPSLQGCPSSLPSPALLHKLQVISKIPKIHKTRLSPNVALTSSRNRRLIIH